MCIEDEALFDWIDVERPIKWTFKQKKIEKNQKNRKEKKSKKKKKKPKKREKRKRVCLQ